MKIKIKLDQFNEKDKLDIFKLFIFFLNKFLYYF